MNASSTNRWQRLAASATEATSATERAKGFSHNTCLPASSARMVHFACRWLGSGMYTASTVSSPRRASYEVYGAQSQRSAASRALSGEREAIPASSQPVAASRPGMSELLMAAVDRTPQWTGLAGIGAF